MDKLVNAICEHLNIKKTTQNILIKCFVGLAVTVFFWAMSCNILLFLEKRVSLNQPIDESLLAHNYIIQNIYQLLYFAISVYCLWYGIKYFGTFLIEIISQRSIPKFKDPTHSIQALMTPLVNDELRLHDAIIKYISKNKSAKDLAVLHIWLYENNLICTSEQKSFLEALKTDFKSKDVLSNASLCDAEAIVQAWLTKSRSNGELSIEAFPYLKKYKDLDGILGIYKNIPS